MNNRKRTMLLLLIVTLFLVTACGGRGSCDHLSCAPENNAMEKINSLLEDAEDGIIDEGESEIGDAFIRAVEMLSE